MSGRRDRLNDKECHGSSCIREKAPHHPEVGSRIHLSRVALSHLHVDPHVAGPREGSVGPGLPRGTMDSPASYCHTFPEPVACLTTVLSRLVPPNSVRMEPGALLVPSQCSVSELCPPSFFFFIDHTGDQAQTRLQAGLHPQPCFYFSH